MTMTWCVKKNLLVVIGLLFSFNVASAAAAVPATLGFKESLHKMVLLVGVSCDGAASSDESILSNPREMRLELVEELINFYDDRYCPAIERNIEHLAAHPELIPAEIHPVVRALVSGKKKLTSFMIYSHIAFMSCLLWDAATAHAYKAQDGWAMVVAYLFSKIDDVAYCMRPEIQAIITDLLPKSEDVGDAALLSYPRGITPLHAAALTSGGLVALMLARGMNPLLTDATGKKALDYAAAQYKATPDTLKPKSTILLTVRCLVQGERKWNKAHPAVPAPAPVA